MLKMSKDVDDNEEVNSHTYDDFTHLKFIMQLFDYKYICSYLATQNIFKFIKKNVILPQNCGI